MEFVGNKDTPYNGKLPAVGKYPEIALRDFQKQYLFLSNESEEGITQQLKVSRIKVHAELKAVLSAHDSLAALSMHWFDETESGETLYFQAVFSLTASELIGIKLSTDATSDAAERQQALTDKKQHCDVQYRQAVDLLLNGKETYRFEVV